MMVPLFLIFATLFMVSNAFLWSSTSIPSGWQPSHMHIAKIKQNSIAIDETQESTKIKEPFSRTYEHAFNQALQGDLMPLRNLIAPTANWDNPAEKANDINEIEKVLLNSANFLIDSRYTILSESGEIDATGGELEVTWIKSATWPLPWRPRIKILGKSTLVANGDKKIISIKDTWESSPLQAVLGQGAPKLWDIYHFKAAPPAETPAYRVVYKGNGYEVRDYAPRAVILGKAIDYTNSREARKARCLPEFLFTNEISTVGKIPEQYSCTAPIEVTFQGKIIQDGELAGKKMNLISWSVGIPTQYGHSLEDLPNPDGGADEELGEEVLHRIDPWRRIAVTSFNGQNQDVGVSKVRNELLEKVQKDGFEPDRLENGQLKFSFLQNDAKVGFKKTGDLSLCIYEPRIINNGNEVALQLKLE